MESKELELLLGAEMRSAIEENIERDPNKIALSKGVPHAREVATQVKYLQRARRKLPSYYAARAILTPLAFEQSSSEECAAHKRFEGDLAVDLTCGLGVDSLYLSKRFRRVIACERNASLAAITRHNLALLGASNVEVLTEDAEEVLKSIISHADLIYADPDRRSAEGRKMVCLEECSPNIAALLPMLKERARHIAIKLSPMFDVTEALVRFGEGSDVEVISLGGEVKEVVVYWSAGTKGGNITATVLGVGSFEAHKEREPITSSAPFDAKRYGYLVVPDASLRKAGLVREWCQSEGLDCYGPYGFATERPTTSMGHIYNIKVSLPYQPKQIKRLLTKGEGIGLIRHSFPLSSSAICKALGVKEGAGSRWAFAEIDRSLWAMNIED